MEAVQFLTQEGQKTIGQAALQFVLSESAVASVLPNIYNQEQLEEFVNASSLPAIAPSDLEKLKCLYAENFGVEPAMDGNF